MARSDFGEWCARYVLAEVEPCDACGQPMLPPRARKRPNEYDHASGCPLAPEKPKRRRRGR